MSHHVDKGVEEVNALEMTEKKSTPHDQLDMNRMGKLQELRRNFKFISIFGYAVILGNTWEFALVSVGIALANGGIAGGIWMFATTCFGMFFVMLSMAEMASMAPTSGGQYHWVSEFAPSKYQKFLSYMVGWLCAVGWQAAMAGVAFATTQQLQGLVALNVPSYEIKGWHSSLMCIAVTAFAILWNTVFVRKLPLLEGIGLVLHVFGFIAFVVVLWVMAPRTDAKQAWTKFEDNSGWGSVGLSTLIAILGPVLTLIGADSSCHLSEELTDAAYILPRAMVATAIVNYSMGFLMTVTILSTLGSDTLAVLTTRLGQPWIQVVLNATGSRAATSVMSAVVCVLLLFCAINQITTSSRQLFAFARDRGLPFSTFLARVRPGWDVPANAVIVTLLCTIVLSFIIAGSPVAFTTIASLAQLGLISSYIVAVGCIFAKRVRGEVLLPSKFNLGRAGLAINTIALAFLALVFLFLFFPTAPNPTAKTMNWGSLIFGFTVIFSLFYYSLWGRHVYTGPVALVKKL